MATVTNIFTAKFSVGDLIHHRLFDYRGVIVDVDRQCLASDDWYEQVAKSRPPKNEPWYHVLVDKSTHTTYVAEQNLEPDNNPNQITHPMLEQYFCDLKNGRYIRNKPIN